MESSNPEHGVERRPSIRNRKKSLFKQFFIDYTQSTTLHGLKYTTEKGVHTIEKIFWVITFTLSLGMCILLISKVWHKWQTSPVIVSFSEKTVQVEMLPFPSLTICPQIKAKTGYYNYTQQKLLHSKHLKMQKKQNSGKSSSVPTDVSAEDIKKFLDVSLICPLPYYMGSLDTEGISSVTNVSTVKNILDVSPKLSDYLYDCRWLGNYEYCSKIFNTVLTEEGVCFNFNGLAAEEIFRLDSIQRDYEYNDAKKKSSGWDYNLGYYHEEGVEFLQQYPYRGQYGSHSPYLEVTFRTLKNDYDENCNVLNKGFRVFTGHPASQPQSSVYSYAILPGQVSALALTVSMMNTSEKLMKYDSQIRQCFFSTEKYLKYFKLYTDSNCMLECMSNYTYQRCQCVQFHMPYSDSRSICTVQMNQCLKEARGFKKNVIKYIEKCNCLPNCNSVNYNAEILKTEFNMEKNFINHVRDTLKDMAKGDFDIDAYLKSFEYSKLDVYYRDRGFVSITRSELYGITDFLANIGGLLGLFLGFSFLSIIEIVYFFTFRLGFFIRKEIKSEKKEMATRASSEKANLKIDDISKIKVNYI